MPDLHPFGIICVQLMREIQPWVTSDTDSDDPDPGDPLPCTITNVGSDSSPRHYALCSGAIHGCQKGVLDVNFSVGRGRSGIALNGNDALEEPSCITRETEPVSIIPRRIQLVCQLLNTRGST